MKQPIPRQGEQNASQKSLYIIRKEKPIYSCPISTMNIEYIRVRCIISVPTDRRFLCKCGAELISINQENTVHVRTQLIILLVKKKPRF